MIKKTLFTSLMIMSILTFIACGSPESNDKTEKQTSQTTMDDTKPDKSPDESAATKKEIDSADKEGFWIQCDDSVPLGTPSTELDPQSIYRQLQYTPEMFYGDYHLAGGEEALEKYHKDMDFFEYDFSYSPLQVTQIPYRIEAGPHTLHHMINYIDEHKWMRLSFLSQEQYLADLYCAYNIDGNKLICTPLDSYEYDEQNGTITYALCDFSYEYEFEFKGRELVLSHNGKSVSLTSGLDSYQEDYFHVECYPSPESEILDNINKISFDYRDEGTDPWIYFEDINGTPLYNAICVLQENGLMTFTIPWESGAKTYQYVFFYGANDGLVLTDGINTYYYNNDLVDRNKNILVTNLTDAEMDMLNELSEQELENIVEKKEDLMAELATAFTDAGIHVTIDETTGELAVDSSILFGGDSAELTAKGKEFLNQFMEVYANIILSEKYQGFVAKTMIEGHTALLADSTYESGLPLSEERANVVKEYCLSTEMKIDADALNLESMGCSNSKPIYDENGDVNLEASRRVSFKFIINLNQ